MGPAGDSCPHFLRLGETRCRESLNRGDGVKGVSVPSRWRQSSGRRGAGSLGTMGDTVQGNSVPSRWNSGSMEMGCDGDGIPVPWVPVPSTSVRHTAYAVPPAYISIPHRVLLSIGGIW